MEHITANKFNNYANSMGMDKNGNLRIINLNPEQETRFFTNLKKNSFFGLANIYKTTRAEGNTVGLSMPMPSTTDTTQNEREPKAGFISPPQLFKCRQVNFDSFVSYAKLDAMQDYLEEDFNNEFDFFLDKNTLSGLLMVAFNGTQDNNDSAPNQNPMAQDVAKGWPQLIRDNAANHIINAPEVGEGKTYPNLTALFKAALAKIPQPHRAHSDLIAICGRNVLADYPVKIEYADLSPRRNEIITISEKLIGGIKAIGAPYFPENSVLITRLDNLSLYVHTGTIRRFMNNDTPSKNRLENYQSISLDFIVEDYNATALIENIQL